MEREDQSYMFPSFPLVQIYILAHSPISNNGGGGGECEMTEAEEAEAAKVLPMDSVENGVWGAELPRPYFLTEFMGLKK